ncbi:chromatin assembly factor 1 subunit FAS1 [Gastrolobium bilobum]|uniref:chromatin assembly factor 1 subunit FAS1 n=1 Tax=Gastrolobium bilobum TaxID=150636 RepID=UPI002AB2E302|nr:chromatin assembly factor 1 subunit FAS1 [Gastrolobium bilobum]
MADTTIIDVDVPPEDPKNNRAKNRKQKKVSPLLQNLKSAEEKQAHIEGLEKELVELFGYYKEMMDQKVSIELSQCGGSRNAVVAALMEESDLPLSRLVDEIHDDLNKEVANGTVVLAEPVTHALVKSSVLIVGQRMMYGVPNADADMLEDHSESCLWCWETRDVKLIPKSVRGLLVVRRTCRRRINERIMAVSEMIESLKKLESELNYDRSLIKASAKLSKAFTEADIRLLVDGLLQKNSENMDKKKSNHEERLLIKQLEKNRREAEKEKEGKHNELREETLLNESDLKLLQGEARNDEKYCEKRKQQKKQVEEVEKNQRRREKEEAELKKKRGLQKQASIMERFLKRSKINPSCQNDNISTKSTASDSSSCKSEVVSESVTHSMDYTLASSSDVTLEDIRKLHFSSWRYLGQSIRSNKNQRWGLRQNPRTQLVKELKLTATKAAVHDDEPSMEKLVHRFGECSSDIGSCPLNADSSLDAKKYTRGRQLLQFDKSHRPAFYGVWSTKSHVVGPRHPLRRDPSLDYDVSSDDEWEEEEPGESLSDCDKDEEECQEECSKSDGESEDGFFVPDGYLSEDEGAQVDRMDTDIDIEGADRSPSCKDDIESEEFCALLRQQKYVNNLTEHALRKSQPLIIPNFIHNKEFLLLDHNISGTLKLEHMCLQALCMYAIPGSSYIEISMDKTQNENKEACLSNGKGGATPVSDVATIPDSDLPIIVTTIQNCSQGMNKVLGSLQQKFPSASKSLLRNKVREVSDYVDNRLQVKKEVLVRFGLAVKPEKSSGRPRSIAAFFSKRCLPPADESVKPGETSPLPSLKS